MHDSHARNVRYLRLSVTPDCHMRCVYCRPGRYLHLDSPILTAAELVQLAGHLVSRHGVDKVRVTGGEPTARADLLEILRGIAAAPGLRELAITTNGLTLARDAAALKAAGVHRVNVSLDSLRPDTFAAMTGLDALQRVLDGIDAAAAAGLRLKLNCVVLRGYNRAELPDMLAFATDRQLEIRFIELMPMGPLASMWQSQFVPETEMREVLSACVSHWRVLPRTGGAARRWEAVLRSGRRTVVGFIAAMSCPFCDLCDRLRIGADGTVYPCLMDRPAGTLMAAIRPVFRPEMVDALLERFLAGKAAEHPAAGCSVMAGIGG